jgi:flagellar hook protein FlgE
MMRSMFSGISGLRSHQTMMDVVGNNSANVNTAGFKSSRATFQESLTQVVRGATAPIVGQQGGVNPYQLGLGTRVGGVDAVFTQGAAQMTGRSTDLSIQGDGFFIVQRNGQDFYTRAGVFGWDSAGQLVNPSGDLVSVAWEGGATGVDFAAYSNVTINAVGEIRGRDANGDDTHLGTLEMAAFANPAGLERVGDGLYAAVADVQPLPGINRAGNAAVGTIQAGTLEMSNVDLAQEFTNLILAQRGFQANSRIITSSDEMLQDLVNLKR